ncbi:hypothetical protein KIN20_015202 [Parelaphostrongylus tenuis]|uniref:Guanylate cyclase domain-containing protein n=1 Tax=Parelaphostrongylus tenuis TaxID=148309 RepID=A0AAD5N0E1_PARTN|nr:hypothetical protein KIN20_015202 [Parelaphostrongylus tenuis]
MLKLTELVQLIQPADIQLTHKNIMSYLNTLFIVQLKHHRKRSEVEKGSSEAFHQPLCLKESVRRMKSLAEELECKKQQTEHLLYDFVPPMIADALRLGNPVPAQEYADCSVMYTDIPDFYAITGCCKPAEVIDIFAILFKQFDRLIDKFECYKVLSLMDSYLIVSGAPKSNELHAENILNLAIGILFSGHQVIVPSINLPLRVRVGISSGSVVAGVVSHNKPRIVERHQKSSFVFEQYQLLDVGTIKVHTYILLKNEKLSVWEIADAIKGNDQSIDGLQRTVHR